MTTTTLEVPARSPEQRMTALAKGNRIRTQRADLKRDLKAGRVTVHELVLDPPDWLETMRLWDVLSAVPGWGRMRVNRAFVVCGISLVKTIGGLSERQHGELVSYLRTNARRS